MQKWAKSAPTLVPAGRNPRRPPAVPWLLPPSYARTWQAPNPTLGPEPSLFPQLTSHGSCPARGVSQAGVSKAPVVLGLRPPGPPRGGPQPQARSHPPQPPFSRSQSQAPPSPRAASAQEHAAPTACSSPGPSPPFLPVTRGPVDPRRPWRGPPPPPGTLLHGPGPPGPLSPWTSGVTQAKGCSADSVSSSCRSAPQDRLWAPSHGGG